LAPLAAAEAGEISTPDLLSDLWALLQMIGAKKEPLRSRDLGAFFL
jgi:hypothetical protein